MTLAGCWVNPRSKLALEKAKPPGPHFNICLPLADIERLSGDFVCAKYDEMTVCATSYEGFRAIEFANG
jgi:hypothetical protein